MADIAGTVMNATQSLSLSEFYATIEPLIYYVIAMAVYAFFIFKFYRFVASRDVFKIDFEKHRGKGKAAMYAIYIIGYLILFPIIIFIWFGVFSAFLIFISKMKILSSILLVAMALVATIRIATYYNEELSRDIAKLLPLAMLAIFIIDMSYVSIPESINILYQMPLMWKVMVYYLIFVICLEFFLRILHGAWCYSRKRRGSAKEEAPEIPEPEQASRSGLA